MSNLAIWTNESVLAFAQGEDPVKAIIAKAQHIIFQALDRGWKGPPFDPITLAELLHIEIRPRQDIIEAQVTSPNKNNFVLEFNPTRPRGRVRYSIAHEIAHTLFPDCAERVRHRLSHDQMEDDDWQLESLCNIAAAEFLMPLGSWQEKIPQNPGIDPLLDVRRIYDVSTEAVLLRFIHLSQIPCAVFCTSRIEQGRSAGRYRVDYVIGSKSWAGQIHRGMLLPDSSVVTECTAIGYTAKGDESWPDARHMHIESVGIPPYPGRMLPRVAGIIMDTHPREVSTGITHVIGDATEPRGTGEKIIVQVVNDLALSWGGRGFAQAVRNRWPAAQRQYKQWAEKDLKLGAVHFADVGKNVRVASIVAQKGYGPEQKQRIRYEALTKGLSEIAVAASKVGASVHMPRIGCGEAGGAWSIVHEIILCTLSAAGLKVTVYDLSRGNMTSEYQPGLSF